MLPGFLGVIETLRSQYQRPMLNSSYAYVIDRKAFFKEEALILGKQLWINSLSCSRPIFPMGRAG